MTKTRDFNQNIAGRVAKLRVRDSLMPLFEAVMNSVQAIEDVGEPGKGHITVEVERRSEKTASGEIVETAVGGFLIEDNGIGFTEE